MLFGITHVWNCSWASVDQPSHPNIISNRCHRAVPLLQGVLALFLHYLSDSEEGSFLGFPPFSPSPVPPVPLSSEDLLQGLALAPQAHLVAYVGLTSIHIDLTDMVSSVFDRAFSTHCSPLLGQGPAADGAWGPSVSMKGGVASYRGF